MSRAEGRSPASSCSVSCPGWGPSSCRPESWSAPTPPGRCSGPGAARSPWARRRWPSSARRCTWGSTSRCTEGPRPTAQGSPGSQPPMRADRWGTWSAPTGWWPCSSTATTACCAGRRCSAWSSWAWRCSTGRAATGWPGPSPVCAGWSARPPCVRWSWGSSCWWRPTWPPRCSATGSRRGTSWPSCRWRCRWRRRGCGESRVRALRWRCCPWWRRCGSTWRCGLARTAWSSPVPTPRSVR